MKKSLFLLIIVLLVFSHTVFALEKSNNSQPHCGIENCHGLDISCGRDVPKECTAIYKFGDRCRQYAKCGIINGECMFLESEEFKECKLCIQKCQETFKNDMPAGFGCESQCGQ